MDADKVKPHRWLWDPNYPPLVLFDDGEYSAIWGKYEGRKCLGVRYNETPKSSVGYPQYAGNPLWYVEPHFLTKQLLDEFLKFALVAHEKEYIKNCLFAIDEFIDLLKNIK